MKRFEIRSALGGGAIATRWESLTARKTAFTLAEVLITLGIIGVVAAMTLPTLIQQHQKQVYVTQLQKAVNTWDNMMRKMQADEWVTELKDTELFSKAICSDYDCEWFNNTDYNYVNYTALEEIIVKYLKTAKICKQGECTNEYKNDQTYKIKTANTINNSVCGYNSNFFPAKFIGFYSVDGTIYYLGTAGFSALSVVIDVNGDKNPNTIGRDLFTFYLYNYNNNYKGLSPADSCTESVMTNGWKMDY